MSNPHTLDKYYYGSILEGQHFNSSSSELIMKPLRQDLNAFLITLTLGIGMIGGGCEGDNTVEKLGIEPANYPFEIVENGVDLNTDFVLVFGVHGSNYESEEERVKYAISRAEAEGVDALVLGTENRAPDMGDCLLGAIGSIPSGTFFGVKYVAESEHQEYRQWCNGGYVVSASL